MLVVGTGIGLLLTAWLTAFRSAAPRKPNIVLIFADDLGYGDLPSYGAYGYRLPHLDQLASESMRFTHFYAAQPVCTASRTALLTGCYPNRLGMAGALFPNASTGINPEETTLAELLKKAGYATGIFGKWHLGDQPEFLPLQQGFDEYLGLPYSNDMWPIDYDGKPYEAGSKAFRANMPPLPLYDGNKPVEVIRTLDDQARLTARYTERAVEFIRRNKQKPFFLYVPHSMPHVPIAASGRFRGKSGAGLYADVLTELDWSVGEIRKALQANGLDQNTIFIFTSDNGPWLNYGNHAGSAGGLRQGKNTSWEGGLRVPFLVRWPGVVPAGTVNNRLASAIDLLPTLAAAAGAKLPDRKLDGVSLLPLWRGEAGANPRDHFLYYFNRNDLQAVRKGPWKLMFPHTARAYPELPGNDGHPGEMKPTQVPMALYNLSRDPAEAYDVQSQHPEVVQELLQLAEAARQDLGDDLTKRTGANVRPAGKASVSRRD